MTRLSALHRPWALTALHRGARQGIVSRVVFGALPLAAAAVSANLVIGSTSMGSEVTPDRVVEDGPPAEAAAIVPRIDAVLAGLDARIEDIRAQAEKMLDYADAAEDSEEQMRFEEMYGRLSAAAGELEAERDRLRSMRDELATVGGAKRP